MYLLIFITVLVLLCLYNLSGLCIPSHALYYEKANEYISESAQAFGLAKFFNNNIGMGAATTNNKVTILKDTIITYETMLSEMNNARNSINIETFILRDDATGQKLKDILIAKARQGVKVRVIYDSWGCFFTPRKFFQDLRNQGVEVVAFNPLVKAIMQGRFVNRMHSKIAVIDGAEAIIGGFNYGNEYLGQDPKFGYWKGMNVLLKGGCANSMQQIFFKDWYMAWGQEVIDNKEYPKPSTLTGEKVRVVWGAPDSSDTDMSVVHSELANEAKKSISIETAYIIPTQNLFDSLVKASGRGVDVHIIIPAYSDHTIDQFARIYYIQKLLKKGVKVSVYNRGYLHSKEMVVDNKIATIGSANFDRISSFNNYETNAIIYNSEIAHQLQDDFENDLKYSSSLSSQMLQGGVFTNLIRRAAATLLNIV